MATDDGPLEIHIWHDPADGLDMVRLPDVPVYDTQAGAIEFGMDREWLVVLHRMLDEWLAVGEEGNT